MEADGREPVWPPHASQGGEQDDGVSSSQGTSQQDSTRNRFALSSEAESSSHEPESTMVETIQSADTNPPNVVSIRVEEIATDVNETETGDGTSIPDSTGVLSEPPSDLFLLQAALSIQEREGEIIPHVPAMLQENQLDDEMTASTSGVTSPKKRGRKKGSKIALTNPYAHEDEASSIIRPRRKSIKPINLNADFEIDEEEDEKNEPFNEEDFLKQGVFHTIADKPVTSRARASLPAMLQIFKVEDGQIGVFARKNVPKRTQFGPLEGKLRNTEDEVANAVIKWKVQKADQSTLFMDCSDESECNWMMFIRPAKRYSEQNLVAFQHEGNIYFATMKNIDPKTELKVWYTKSYAEFVGVGVLEATAEEVQEMEENDKTWPCFECNRKFRTSDLLQRHLATHDSLHTKPQRGKKGRRGRPRKYPEGYRSRLAVAKLKRAKGLKLRTQDGYACTECGKQFARLYSLTRHMLMHSGEKNFTCPVCKKTFAHTYNKLRHMKKHEEEAQAGQRRSRRGIDEEEEDIWPCFQCDLCFESNELLELHSNIHDMNETMEVDEKESDGALQPLSFVTEVIETAAKEAGITDEGENKDKEAMEVDDVKATNDDEEDDDELSPELVCPECDEEFQDKKTLWLHASAHGQHKPGIADQYRDAFRCEICKRFLQDQEKLEKHMELHTKDDENLIHCEVCNKAVQSRSALACHMKIHAEERCLQCPFCEESFEKGDLLKRHVEVHRKNGQYECPHCPKKFNEYPQIKKHIRSFHSQKEFPCDHCDKVFPRPDKLRLHLLRHSDKKDFLCANCGKQFKRKDKLKEHMQRMHNPQREAEIAMNANKPRKIPFKPQIPPTDVDRFTFKCRLCQVGFKRRGMLVNHLAKMHPDVVIDSIPELNLPIVKPNRNYFCAYCEKVYKSSSKRKIHILKNHPGAQLPPSLRVTKGDPNSPLGDPHTAPAGTTTTHYFACAHCPRQYSTKAKMMDHVRKKHMDTTQQTPSVSSKRGSVVSQIAIMQESLNNELGHIIVHDNMQHGVQQVVIGGDQVVFPSGEAAAAVALAAAATGHPATITVEAQQDHQGGEAVEIQQVVNQDQLQAPQTIQIRYIETANGQQAQVIQGEPVQATDLLTQAMTELSQSINEMRQQSGGDYQPVQQIQRIIHHQGQPTILQTLNAQIPVSQIQIPVSQVPVSQITSASGIQIPVSQNLHSSGSITVTPIPVTQIQAGSIAATQLVGSHAGSVATTVDLSQVRQNVTQFQQQQQPTDPSGPQLTQLHTVAQSMSPVPQQLQIQVQPQQPTQQVTQQQTQVIQQAQQAGQQTQQQPQQVFIQSNWAPYQTFR